MRVLSISHQRDAGPGVFADAVAAAGAELDEWYVAETERPPGDPLGYDAAMVFGGSMNVDDEDRYPWLEWEKRRLAGLIEGGVPLLGVCLGAQLISEAAGGSARRARVPEIGWFEVEVTPEGEADPVMGALAPSFEAFEWHSYECGVPEGAVVLARTPVCAQAFRIGATTWGIQFHAEVSATNAGAWIDEYQVDPDAVAIGINPETLHAETRPRMPAWNQLGRRLCERFLAAARESAGSAAAESARV